MFARYLKRLETRTYQQPAALTRFPNSESSNVALSSSSSSVSAVVVEKTAFLSIRDTWCACAMVPMLESAGVVISASQQSLAIAHDFLIAVGSFRRGPVRYNREGADAIMFVLVSACVHVGFLSFASSRSRIFQQVSCSLSRACCTTLAPHAECSWLLRAHQ